MGNFAQANAYVKEAIKIFNNQSKKNSPIELFAVKRNEYLKKNTIKTKEICELLLVEMLYLWVNFPYCDEASLNKMLKGIYFKSSKFSISKERNKNLYINNLFIYLFICLIIKACDQITDKQFISIKCLFEGSIHMCLKNKEFGEQVNKLQQIID